MNLLFTALIVVWAAWLILKKYKPQAVLFVAGGLLLAGSMIMSWGTILPAGKSTGMWSFDILNSSALFCEPTLRPRPQHHGCRRLCTLHG